MMGPLLLFPQAGPPWAFPGGATLSGGDWSRGQLGTPATPLTRAIPFFRLTSAPETTSAGPWESKGPLPCGQKGECWGGWVMPPWGHFWWLGRSAVALWLRPDRQGQAGGAGFLRGQEKSQQNAGGQCGLHVQWELSSNLQSSPPTRALPAYLGPFMSWSPQKG